MKPICIIPIYSQLGEYSHQHALYLAGQPLFCHAITKAQQSQLFQEIIIITDDEVYAEIAQQQNVIVKMYHERAITEKQLINDMICQILVDYSEEQTFMVLNATAIGVETAQLIASYDHYINSTKSHLITVAPLPTKMNHLIQLNDQNTTPLYQQVTDMYYPIDALMLSRKKFYLQSNEINATNSEIFILAQERVLMIRQHQDFVHVLGENYFDYKVREYNNKAMYYQLYDDKLKQPSCNKVLLGDSRTVNIQLAEFKNFGLGGVTLATLMDKIDTILSTDVKLALVSIGVNDFITKYDVLTIRENFKKLIDICQRKKIRLLLTTIPYTLYRYEVNNDGIKEMNQWLITYCHDNEVPLLELNHLLSYNGVLKYQYTNDGLHFTEEANRLIEQQYYHFIKQNS